MVHVLEAELDDGIGCAFETDITPISILLSLSEAWIETGRVASNSLFKVFTQIQRSPSGTFLTTKFPSEPTLPVNLSSTLTLMSLIGLLNFLTLPIIEADPTMC